LEMTVKKIKREIELNQISFQSPAISGMKNNPIQ